MSSEQTALRPIVREGSTVFAAIAAATLLVGGLAGIARSDDAAPIAAPAAHTAAAGDHGTAGHPDGDEVAAAGGDAAHGHDAARSAGSPAHDAHEPGADGTTVAHDADTHDADMHGTDEHGTGQATDGTADGAGHGGTGHDAAGEGHGGHAAAGGAHHATGCADDHPATTRLVREVRGELATTYKDIATLIALGYHPYFDSLVPGGYPPGGEGISHWINPNYIDDGVVLDPQRPETILLDDWNWPIGMMFINDPGVPPKPVYANDDGTTCSPWHPHTDYPARFGWYYYRAMYDRELEGEVPAQTPEMMHVWAAPNPAGVYAAHDYPPREVRQGAPGPMPSYFSETDVN